MSNNMQVRYLFVPHTKYLSLLITRRKPDSQPNTRLFLLPLSLNPLSLSASEKGSQSILILLKIQKIEKEAADG